MMAKSLSFGFHIAAEATTSSLESLRFKEDNVEEETWCLLKCLSWYWAAYSFSIVSLSPIIKIFVQPTIKPSQPDISPGAYLTKVAVSVVDVVHTTYWIPFFFPEQFTFWD